MSDTNTHIGKVKKLDISGTKDEICQALCNQEDIVCEEGEWYDALMNKTEYDKYIFVGEDVYEVVVNKITQYEDICYASKGDDAIDFVLQYYSGGTCFSEALEAALKNIK